ncbi:hypothetical protein QBC44DRAFT_390816 [Cladorrhinum sp. PSN332]|nr:hypothetical protein QBC44DRAFT_390816 [Cladorrhinum sp. PSN332]
MAGPIGAAASDVALVGLCGPIIKYIQDIKGGLDGRQRLLTDIYSTKSVLETLPQPLPLAAISKKGGPLDLLQKELTSLHEDLVKWKKGLHLKPALWPLMKKGFEERVNFIASQKTSLILALLNGQVSLA